MDQWHTRVQTSWTQRCRQMRDTSASFSSLMAAFQFQTLIQKRLKHNIKRELFPSVFIHSAPHSGPTLLSSWKALMLFFLTSVRFVGGGWGSSVKHFRRNWCDLLHSESLSLAVVGNKHLDLKCTPLPELSLLSLLTLLLAGGYDTLCVTSHFHPCGLSGAVQTELHTIETTPTLSTPRCR